MKRIKISGLGLQLHPKVGDLVTGDVVDLNADCSINELSETQLSILLENIVLNVLPLEGCVYQLLSPNVVYNILSRHPAAKNMYVNVLVHSPKNKLELLELILTLNLVLPSLSLISSSHISKTIHARYQKLKLMGCQPISIAKLSRLANKKRSTFRR
ncbi:hypothetical protein [Psychromonas sp. KJ10-2]|uniref:hypothetical protein n=1 Tax=Psychromonas sp. KJ10-2 TaxID=3391822 RepID=UPI0039B5E4C6